MKNIVYDVDFVKFFTDEEKEKVLNYLNENIEDKELHSGWNYAVDVSAAIKRTANVDIFVK